MNRLFLLHALSRFSDSILRKQLEYALAENRAIRQTLNKRVVLSTYHKALLAKLAKALGLKHLRLVSTFFSPETVLAWNHKKISQKWDTSRQRGPGRPKTKAEIEKLVVDLALDNPRDGFGKIMGKLLNLKVVLSKETIQNILQRHGIPIAPLRQKQPDWAGFIRRHLEALVATDFLTVEVWHGFSLVTYYVLFFIHLGTRKVHLAGVSPHPHGEWMKQIARNLTDPDQGFLNLPSENPKKRPNRYLIHDQDAKFCPAFKRILRESGVRLLQLPYRSPNLNAFAERWVRTVKEECLSKFIIVGEPMLRHLLKNYLDHYHHERGHQGLDNLIPFPGPELERGSPTGKIVRKPRLATWNYYYREPENGTFSKAKKAG